MTSRGPDKQDLAINVADRLRQLGLQLPALVVLEAGRPLAFVAGQLLWLAQPMLALLLPRSEVSRAAELLEDPESVQSMIDRLGPEQSDRVGGA
jgi:hypothetical protein